MLVKIDNKIDMLQNADNSPLNDTETRILNAAEREFMAKGFAGARTTSIAEAAGVTHAMFHYYFRTKEKLFDRIISEKLEMLKELIIKSFSDMDQPLGVLLYNLIWQHIDFISANPDLPGFLIRDVFNNPERLNLFAQKINNIVPDLFSVLQKKIDSMAAEGKCRRLDARLLMLDIVSLNIFPYVASPLINRVLNNCMVDSAAFLELRKQENYDTIIRKLRP